VFTSFLLCHRRLYKILQPVFCTNQNSVCILLDVTSIVQNVCRLFSVFSIIVYNGWVTCKLYMGYVYNWCIFGNTLTMKLDIGYNSNTYYPMFTVSWNLDLTISHLPAESCSCYRIPDENRTCSISERWHAVSVLFRQWNYARFYVYIGEPSRARCVTWCHVMLNCVEKSVKMACAWIGDKASRKICFFVHFNTV